MPRPKTVHGRCPICRMQMQQRHRPYCIHCRRAIEEAKMEIDDSSQFADGLWES